MSWFRSPAEIEADMLADLESLTGLKLGSTDVRREEVIKIKQASIAFSHAYAQIDRVSDDFFPGSSSEQALIKHLESRQMDGRKQSQPSNGTILHTGVPGTVVQAGNRIRRISNGSLFYLKETSTIDETGQMQVAYQSVLSGQEQNVDVLNDSFEMVSPQVGVDNACTNVSRFLDGRNIESPAEMLARIKIHDQDLDTGGNITAYERFAKNASDAVVNAKGIKNPRGQDTVDVVITSGTTDIEAAVLNGDDVERVPSEELIAVVQAYVESRNPTTDDVLIIAPDEDDFDSVVTYDLYDESQRPLVDATITQVWKIFVYGILSGDDADPTSLERAIDARVGHLIRRRRVSDFGDESPEYTVPEGHILAPGALTLQSFT